MQSLFSYIAIAFILITFHTTVYYTVQTNLIINEYNKDLDGTLNSIVHHTINIKSIKQTKKTTL